MKKLEPFDFLDDKQWSFLWKQYVDKALLFIPSKVGEISCILPIPEQESILILSENGLFISNEPILSTLHSYAAAHCYPDYSIITHCLKHINLFGQYKLPWFCPHFALFPLESTEQTIWLKPLKIQDIFKYEGQYYVELLNGPTLLLPLSKRRIVTHAETASLLLATISRGNSHTVRTGITPLDYLDLPNTPFAHYLSKRKLLKKFLTPIGALHHYYQISYALYHCADLIEDLEGFYNRPWLQ